MTQDERNLIWLASYPKSGNTWVRIFLYHVLNPGSPAGMFPELAEIPIASNRSLIDRYLGTNSSDLLPGEISDLQPEVYRRFSKDSPGFQILKTHDAYRMAPSGIPVFPEDVSRAVVYIVRNPLDLAVSYSFHSGKPVQTIIDQLNDPGFKLAFNESGLMAQIPQKLGTWSHHVTSWTKQKAIPSIIIRYEDLLDDPYTWFRFMLSKLAIRTHEPDLQNAVESCRFEQLKKIEENQGFREKPLQSVSFFREGKKNIYQSHLSRTQIEQILALHESVMHELGYHTDSL